VRKWRLCFRCGEHIPHVVGVELINATRRDIVELRHPTVLVPRMLRFLTMLAKRVVDGGVGWMEEIGGWMRDEHVTLAGVRAKERHPKVSLDVDNTIDAVWLPQTGLTQPRRQKSMRAPLRQLLNILMCR
jgi:hypothetical protein